MVVPYGLIRYLLTQFGIERFSRKDGIGLFEDCEDNVCS